MVAPGPEYFKTYSILGPGCYMIYSKRGGFIKTRRFESDWTLMYGYTKTGGQSESNTSKRSSFRWIDMDVSTFLYDIDRH